VGEQGRIAITVCADSIFETATRFGSKIVAMGVCVCVSGEGVRRAERCWARAAERFGWVVSVSQRRLGVWREEILVPSATVYPIMESHCTGKI
jgi:hypothetical protein